MASSRFAWGLLLSLCSCGTAQTVEPDRFASLIVDPRKAKVDLFWRTEGGRPYKSLGGLKADIDKRGRHLRFAMNAGMYEAGNQPKGLLVQDGQTLNELDVGDGDGNFYVKPNGVFYVTDDDRAFVVPTPTFARSSEIRLATQSGPMLLVDGHVNPRLVPGSSNLNVRNGVCVRDDHSVVFAISRQPVSFYELAVYFKSQNCKDALYLDGFVSRMYLPEQGITQMDGDFAAIVAIVD